MPTDPPAPKLFTCPVCSWLGLEQNPAELTYEICPQCGVEFGYEDPELYPKIREAWREAGQPYWASDSEWQAKLNAIGEANEK